MTAATAGYVQSRVYMDTIVTIQVPGAPAGDLAARVEEAFGWFREVEKRCSRFDAASELRRLCAQVREPVPVSPLLFRAIEFAVAIAEASEGAFDPAVGGVMERRGFDRGYRTGDVAASGIRSPASFDDVLLDARRQTVTLRRPLQLDLGAVAKGLAIDLAGETLREFGSYLVNAGGDIRVHGLSPAGRPWRIGVRDPANPSALLATLSLTEGAVCTSGGYERPASDGGHHIVSPATGASPTEVASVTVVAPSAIVADALSTAAFVLGPGGVLTFAEAQGVEALIVDRAANAFLTQGMKGFF